MPRCTDLESECGSRLERKETYKGTVIMICQEYATDT